MCFTSSGPGELSIVDGNITAHIYQAILLKKLESICPTFEAQKGMAVLTGQRSKTQANQQQNDLGRRKYSTCCGVALSMI